MPRRSAASTSRWKSQRISGLASAKRPVEALPQARMFGAVRFDGAESVGGQREVAAGPTGVRFIEAGEDQALPLEALQRDEHRRLRDRPAGALLEGEHQRHAVGLTLLVQHGEQDVEFEVLEGWRR